MPNNETETIEALVSGVTKIANDPHLTNALEPQVCFHGTIEKHQTRRILLAYALLVEIEMRREIKLESDTR